MATSNLQGVSFDEHDGPGTAAIIDRLTWIWAQENPEGPTALREGLAQKHMQCRGFRCVTASSDGEIVGYAYGMYEGQGTGLSALGETAFAGAHDLIAEWKDREKSPGVPWVNAAWGEAFDIAEVQVLEEYRRRRIAKRLVRQLCCSLPADDRVVLIVEPDNTGALNLYQQIGFKDLIGFPISSQIVLGPGQILMGLERASEACGAAGK